LPALPTHVSVPKSDVATACYAGSTTGEAKRRGTRAAPARGTVGGTGERRLLVGRIAVAAGAHEAGAQAARGPEVGAGGAPSQGRRDPVQGTPQRRIKGTTFGSKVVGDDLKAKRLGRLCGRGRAWQDAG